MKPLSVVIIAKNEEENIRRCLDSVKWADEIILIDNQSVDRTAEIAKMYGARIFSPAWQGYGAAKKEGVKQASYDWVLSVDADEEISSELKTEIRNVLNTDTKYYGYYIPRKTMFLGRWIKHCGWYPNPVLRLFLKSKGDFNEAVIHEKVIVKGNTSQLKNELLHYSYPHLEEYFRKFNHYTTIGAEASYKKGITADWFDILIRPPVSFLKHYLLKQGIRDGIEGFLISVLSSIAVMVKYAKLREIYRKKTINEDEKNG